MTADMINGLFEAVAGGFILNHCRVLYKDKTVRGVSILSTAFFFAWGLWNLYFYPSLDQYWSYLGGWIVMIANCLWLGLMVYYGRDKGVVRGALP